MARKSSISTYSGEASPPPENRTTTQCTFTEPQKAFIGPHHGPKIWGKNSQSTTKVTLMSHQKFYKIYKRTQIHCTKCVLPPVSLPVSLPVLSPVLLDVSLVPYLASCLTCSLSCTLSCPLSCSLSCSLSHSLSCPRSRF